MAQDWTIGPAKWLAVGVLAGASFAGVAFSLMARDPHRPVAIERQAIAPPPVPQAKPLLASAEPGPLPQEEHSEAGAQEPPALEDPGPAYEEAPPERWPAKPVLTRTININTATAAELELLPGIGPAMAARILEHRTKVGRFTRVEQLDDVRGIGPKTLEKLRPLVRIE